MRRLAIIGLMIFTPLPLVNAADNLIENPTILPGTLILEVITPERPVFQGTTSLSPGTTILITLSRTRVGDYSQYMAEINTVVNRGKFETEKFTEDGGDLKPGEYLVMIMAVLSEPITTATVMGEESENHNTQMAYCVVPG